MNRAPYGFCIDFINSCNILGREEVDECEFLQIQWVNIVDTYYHNSYLQAILESDQNFLRCIDIFSATVAKCELKAFTVSRLSLRWFPSYKSLAILFELVFLLCHRSFEYTFQMSCNSAS